MKEIIAMHGWSGDSVTWHPWVQQFASHSWQWQSAERGYGSLPPRQPNWQPQHICSEGNQRVIICHSLGVHLLNNKVLALATDVVLLCSFSRFLPKNSTSRGLITALRSMQNLIGTKEESKMLRTFHAKACQPSVQSFIPSEPIQQGLSSIGRERLKKDLELLINTSCLPIGFPRKARVLVVEGQEDAIVLPCARESLLEDLKNYLEKPPSFLPIPGMGHALISPDLIEKVRNWLELSQ